ncbi:DUF4349 domain-containing protein [Anaerobacillus sp. MEB173]|uniref:DUF4349 domain-containing protein n=1 Tax=Anaerobacillus sp. MEB173 TaxID=3383345 RepID=UPI003F9292A7
MVKKIKWYAMFLILCVLSLAACGGNQYSSDLTSMDHAANEVESKEEAAVVPQGQGSQGEFGAHVSHDGADQSQKRNEVTANRMVIYHAELSIEVTNYSQTEALIQQQVNKQGGYVVEAVTYDNDDDNQNGYLVVRVPQENFDLFLNDVEKSSVKVNNRHIRGSDVTEEFVDLESRLKSKRSVEERLLTFMETASNTEDLLAISRDLAIVQEEIEQITGRMNYLQNQVDLATITIYLSESKMKIAPIQDQETLYTWLKAKSLFVETINKIIGLLSTLTVVVIGLSPVIVPIAVIILLIIYRRKSKIGKKENL